MCLILVAWRSRDDYPLVIAANRDEFHARPSAAARFWSDQPAILAGRDLQAMGTWMGVTRNGKFAAVTNYRGAREPSAVQSRGALVTQFLLSGEPPAIYVKSVLEKAQAYSGFNLLAGDDRELWWFSNRDSAPRQLEAGIHGLGNTLLDAPEVDAAKARFERALEGGVAVETLFGVLAESQIVNPQYGTRCSTIVLIGSDRRLRFAERSFAADGSAGETVHFEFSLPA